MLERERRKRKLSVESGGGVRSSGTTYLESHCTRFEQCPAVPFNRTVLLHTLSRSKIKLTNPVRFETTILLPGRAGKGLLLTRLAGTTARSEKSWRILSISSNGLTGGDNGIITCDLSGIPR